jgi:hypothetical protein
MSRSIYRGVVAAVVAASLMITGCADEPSMSEQMAATSLEAFQELHDLADQAIRDGSLGDTDERLAWMEEAAIRVGTLPGRDPVRNPEMLPERRFWTSNGTLKPLEDMTSRERQAFLSWARTKQVADAIGRPTVTALVGRAQRGF